MQRWVFALAVCVLAGGVRGEIVGADTIEWMVADSDLVVRGRIVELAEDGGGEFGRLWKLTIRVDETVKGKKAESVTVRAYGDQGLTAGSTDPKNPLPRLCFLVNSARVTDRPHARVQQYPYALRNSDAMLMLRPRAFIPAGRLVWRSPRFPMHDWAVGMDMGALEAEEEIMAAARAAAADPPLIVEGKPLRVTLHPDHGSSAFTRLWSGSAVLIHAPATPRLEALARTWLTTPGQRHSGLQAIRPFKSEANARLLVECLSDNSGLSYEGAGKGLRVYQMYRQIAYLQLQKWGFAVPRPRMELPEDGYRQVPAWAMASVAGLLLGLVLLFRWRRGMALAAMVLGLAGTAACIASIWYPCELTASTSARRWWASCYRGGVQFVTIADWPDRRRLSVGVFGPPPHDPLHALWAPYAALRSPADSHLGVVLAPNRVEVDHGGGNRAGFSLHVPPYYAIPPLAALGVLWPASRLRWGLVRRRRRRRGLCPDCGYDLRATPERCPECGRRGEG